jgi:mono/diheme cytochrome c family protein
MTSADRNRPCRLVRLGLGQVDPAQSGSRRKWQSFAVLTIDLGMLELTIRLAVLLLLLGMSGSSAQENGPAALEQRGQALAERMCSQCHAIGKRDQSSHTAAPPFRALDQRLEFDSFMDRLREGLMVGHPDMPVFRFTREDARAFVLFSGQFGHPEGMLTRLEPVASVEMPCPSPPRRLSFESEDVSDDVGLLVAGEHDVGHRAM